MTDSQGRQAKFRVLGADDDRDVAEVVQAILSAVGKACIRRKAVGEPGVRSPTNDRRAW